MRKNLVRIFAVLLVILWALPVSADEQTGYWSEDPEVLEDYEFTIAFVGDTQTITRNHPEKLHDMYSWLAENRDKMNLQPCAACGVRFPTPWFAATTTAPSISLPIWKTTTTSSSSRASTTMIFTAPITPSP